MEIGGLLSDDFTVEVPFGDADPPALVTLRYLPRDRFAALVKRATKIGFDPKTHQRAETTDHVEANRLIGEAAVTGWSGITEKGQDVPFSAEKRDLFMARWHEFAKFVLDSCTSLETMVQAEREKIRGN